MCGWFSDSFVSSFVAIILLLSLDFWTVKNITGRIMTGLRWSVLSFPVKGRRMDVNSGLSLSVFRWNYIDDSGASVWVFEQSEQEDQPKFSKAEVQIFWAGLVVYPVLWVRTVNYLNGY